MLWKANFKKILFFPPLSLYRYRYIYVYMSVSRGSRAKISKEKESEWSYSRGDFSLPKTFVKCCTISPSSSKIAVKQKR